MVPIVAEATGAQPSTPAVAATVSTASPTTPTANMSGAAAAATPTGIASLPSTPAFAALDSYAQVLRALSDCVLERQLYALLNWTQVEEAAKAVVHEGALSKACETWGVATQQALHLAKLSLYDVQFLLPAVIPQESRASLAALLGRVVSTSSAFRGDEAQVSVLRAGTLTAVQLNQTSQVESLLAAEAEGEKAEIDVAAAIEKHVLVAAREKQLKRPVLFVLVAACREVEQADRLVKGVQTAREQLKALGMGDGALSVEIAATSSEAAAWLDSLRAVPGARQALTIAPPSGPSNGASATDRTSSALLNSLRGGSKASALPDASLEDARVAFVRASDQVLEASSTPTGPRASRVAQQQQQQHQGQDGEENGTGEAGSALAGAKLSNKKKEALSQVPCKFFRANGCSAGNACPFAHTMPGETQQKATCQWFLKGSCRFGHKCALAHILPGQPMSMDRKNKRAAQQAGGAALSAQQQQQQQQAGSKQRQLRQGTASVDLGRLPPAGPSGSSGPGASRGRLPMSAQFSAHQRDMDFPFGLPDDLLATSPTPPPPRSGGGIHLVPGMDYDPSVLFAAQQNFFNELGNGTQRPLSVPRGGEGRASIGVDHHPHHLNGLSIDGAAPVGSPPSSRAFGTSPFSHPGGHSVFFSGSQDSEGGAGPFGRARSGTGPGGRNFGGRAEDADPLARWRASSGAVMLDEVDEAGNFNEEDFLPSSLSDLLTPAELERRRRSVLAAAAAGKLPGASAPATQSMPSGPGANLGTLWELGLRTNRAQRALEEEMRALERAAAELGSSTTSSYGFAAHNSHLSSSHLLPQQQQRRATHVPMAESDARVAAALANLQAQAAQANSNTSYSPGTRAALHAPGQSLPQGLAAGLSRLHLMPQPQRTTSGGGGADGLGASGIGSSHMLGSTGRRPSQLGVGSYDSELGPTAPSSVLAHRANPLSLAMARSIGGVGGLGASLEHHHHQQQQHGFGQSPLSHGHATSVGTSTRRPHSSSIGQLPEGIAIPAGFPSSPGASALGAGTAPKHPGMHRVRTAVNSANAQGSPLALPTTGEEVDDAIFELE